MIIKILFTSALKSLSHHLMRSLLTTLGIIIGVVSIIGVSAIGEGAKDKVNQAIAKLGTNFVIVISQSQRQLSQRSGHQSPVITPKDLNDIVREIKEVALISPGIRIQIRTISEGTSWETPLTGVNEQYFEIRNWRLLRGDFFNINDVRSRSKVAIIGSTVARELFKNKDPINAIIRIKNLPFRVIGILEEKGKRPDGSDQDDAIFAPFTTVQRRFIGQKEKYGALLMSVKTKETMEQTTQQIRSVLRQTHRIKENDPEDFSIFSQKDISQAADASTKVLNLLLFIIAAISLIVGGVGIMNIMLVSVSERTHEIGIHMALGATTRNILYRFIIEAIIICLFGGLLGISIGIVFSIAIGLFLGWPIVISATSLIISLTSSLLIGLFFGYYPAYKASQLNPIDALAER